MNDIDKIPKFSEYSYIIWIKPFLKKMKNKESELSKLHLKKCTIVVLMKLINVNKLTYRLVNQIVHEVQALFRRLTQAHTAESQ